MSDAKPDATLLGREIARARERAGLSPFDLGVAVGMPEAEVLACEAGRRPVSAGSLRAIALACGTSSAKLLANSRSPRAVPDTPLWRELGVLFAGLSQASREALVRHARALRERQEP